jgi:hypothetical protein
MNINISEKNILPKMREHYQQVRSKNKKEAVKIDADVESSILADDALCVRYLRANELDYEDGAKQLFESVVFRSVEHPDRITAEQIESSLATGKMFEYGLSKLGNPVIYLRTGLDGASTSEAKIQHLLYCLEHTLRLGRDRWLLIIDFGYVKDHPEQKGKFSMADIAVGKRMVSLLGTHYPERLQKCYFVRPSGAFHGFYSMCVKPFLAKKTAEKMVFLKEMDEEGKQMMLDVVEAPQLLKEYGGDVEYVYDAAEFVKQVEERRRASSSPQQESSSAPSPSGPAITSTES